MLQLGVFLCAQKMMVIAARGRASSHLFSFLCSSSEGWALRSRSMQCTTSTLVQCSPPQLKFSCRQFQNQLMDYQQEEMPGKGHDPPKVPPVGCLEVTAAGMSVLCFASIWPSEPAKWSWFLYSSLHWQNFRLQFSLDGQTDGQRSRQSPPVKRLGAGCWRKYRREEGGPQLHTARSYCQYSNFVGNNQLSQRTLQAQAAGSTMTDTSKQSQYPDTISYLSQADATAIDELLMGPLGFSVDQLMELAGLSVATAIAEVYGVHQYPRVLVICGPGNNGGDGLVAARHLHHFGYKPSIVYPKRTDKALYHGLVTQLGSLSVPFLAETDLPEHLKENFDIVVDAMFGFSFKGKPRPPFDTLLQRLLVPNDPGAENAGFPFVASIDIPSGWHVEEGDIEETGLMPDMLVSLTAPKNCAKHFQGAHHFLGGRFVPPAVVEKFGLQLPAYSGTSMCVRIGKQTSIDVAALRENYVGAVLLEDQANSDPIKQFQVWFEDAVSAGVHEPNAMTLATADAEGNPSARMVLLKGYDERGFVWYTNYGSRKAGELDANPRAALVFFWEKFNRSVRIEGPVGRVPEEESDKYFHSRPRGSQIGAMVSSQSSVIEGRHVLDQCYNDLVEKYADGAIIPKPNYWGGYRLHPVRIEFWQGRESRLHDRLRYILTSKEGERPTWSIERLAP